MGKEKKRKILNKVLKLFKLKSLNDNVTIFTREDGFAALHNINNLRQDIINNFPCTNSIKCKQGVKSSKDAITVLRQLVRYYNIRIVSYRLKIPGTRGRQHKYQYKLAI